MQGRCICVHLCFCIVESSLGCLEQLGWTGMLYSSFRFLVPFAHRTLQSLTWLKYWTCRAHVLIAIGIQVSSWVVSILYSREWLQCTMLKRGKWFQVPFAHCNHSHNYSTRTARCVSHANCHWNSRELHGSNTLIMWVIAECDGQTGLESLKWL